MLHIRPTMLEEPGVAWLELLIAFEAHGWKLEPALNERNAADMVRPTLTTRQLLKQFKDIAKFIIETCADHIDANFFRSAVTNGTRLRAVAIHHSAPSINCIPAWSNEVAYIITQAVLRQKCRMTKALVKSHAEGTLELPWTSLNTK